MGILGDSLSTLYFLGWGGREHTGEKQRDRDKAILKSLVQEKVGSSERMRLKGMVYCILADNGTHYTGQLKRWLLIS